MLEEVSLLWTSMLSSVQGNNAPGVQIGGMSQKDVCRNNSEGVG